MWSLLSDVDLAVGLAPVAFSGSSKNKQYLRVVVLVKMTCQYWASHCALIATGILKTLEHVATCPVASCQYRGSNGLETS